MLLMLAVWYSYPNRLVTYAYALLRFIFPERHRGSRSS